MFTVLVTGGAGFIVSHLAEALLQRGDRVLVLDDLSSGSVKNIASLRSKASHDAAPASPAVQRPPVLS